MLLGRVVGTVVCSQKVSSLVGLKLLAVKQLDASGEEKDSYVVAVDTVDANLGEIVLYATGSAARQTDRTHNKPADAVIMAIVDTWEIEGQVIYQKEQARKPEQFNPPE
jgi:ethanolamine utilization protein EutN/carbon dioxide concentrating mechanism protein CcmL